MPHASQRDEDETIVAFYEDQSRRPDQQAVNRALLATLALRPGERWLEAGCGSGALTRAVGARLQPGGCAVGLDLTRYSLARARQFAAEQGFTVGFSFAAGSAFALPFPEAAFDGAYAARLLLNVPDPDAVVAGLVRVVRPGGCVAVVDWDFETLVVDAADRALTRRILLWRADHYGSNSWSGRQLYGRLRAAGLRRVTVTPVVSFGLDDTAALPDALERAARAAREAGAITPAEHAAWTADLRARIEAGVFFASINYYIAAGLR